jgi:hypothetical protein
LGTGGRVFLTGGNLSGFVGTRGGVFLTGGNFSGCGVFTWLTSRAVRVVYEKFIVVGGGSEATILHEKRPLIASKDASPCALGASWWPF